MSTVPSISLEIEQGDDEVIDIQIVPPAGGDPDLTSCKLLFYIKTSPTDSDAAALIAKTSAGAGITITDAAQGIANVQIQHVDTSALTVEQTGRKLPWSLQVIDAIGDITTLAKGTITINRDLIQATT